MSKARHDSSLPITAEEVNTVDRSSTRMVNKVDRLADVPLAMAKAGIGAAVEQGIGDQPLKRFGDKGLMSKVVTGEKVPDYLARIYQDRESRRRFALALLEDDRGVTVETVVRWTNEKVG